MKIGKKRFQFDHDLHIHSQLSSCSADSKQTPERILSYAKENGLSTVCVTDHYWDSAIPDTSLWYAPQNFDHISQSLPLPQANGIRFLFGCETELRADLTLGIPEERFSDFDFVIIPTTHLHMTGHVINEEDAASLEARARLWFERLEGLLDKSLPFEKIGIAHLACALIAPSSVKDLCTVLDSLDRERLVRVFQKAASRGVGIELNSDDMRLREGAEDTILRIFRIAKEQGCKFYMGSDAHHPEQLDAAKAIFERAIDLLELTEEDKFSFLRKSS